ncbi:uncharacterized protein LOC124320227 isoform X2 [Daphnia pulicaria]|uniref:uncharacterized protein LOC124320227 isoform X2 n=1 Tax=Daphnia pulicaria TaxID=35523 RepID=UPI001EEA8A3F|nr:uncharacterized protein LOC124320227 isoform X2 [Daphnia pulicaria]
MSTPNGFREGDQTPSAGPRPATKAATAWHHQSGNDPLEDVFLKPMEKPWRSPPPSGGQPSSTTKTLPMQMSSSTPLHFSPGVALSPANLSAATTRMSLDLFHKNAFKYQMEQPSRPSLTTDFALSALKNSFSMSSLSHPCHQGGAGTPSSDTPPSAVPQTPDVTARLKWERPFNSLTRIKEKGVGRVQWRRSFGASPLTAKEDAGALNAPTGSAGQNNGNADWLGNADYTFLMSCDLIESCRSLNGEMSWDNGDLENLRMAEMNARSTGTNNQSVAVGCQTDAEVTIPDLQLQLRLLREWLKRMESKVPKLVLRPKWTRETLDRRIVEYKRLKREIDGHSAEFGAACQRCASWNPKLGRLLENRYHRLLLRILEWTYHLEALAKKPPEFWNGRRAAISSPESEVGLPRKQARLDDSSPSHINHIAGQVDEQEMRQSNAEGGLSPPLPAAVPVSTSRTNMGVYEFKHPDTDSENSRPQNSPIAQEDVKGSARKRSSNLSDGALVRSNDSSENEWIYSSNTSGRVADEIDGHDTTVRKKLSFESDEDNDSSSKSWFQYSSESDWLQGGGIELDEASELEESLLPPPSGSADSPEESEHKDASRVYNKEKVHKLVTEAEQMVSLSGEACRSKNRKPEARYNNPEVVHNSECDASSELTSEGETDEEDVQETPGSSGRRSATLNRTFLVPGSTETVEASPVVMRTRQRIKPQRPLSFSGLSGTTTLGSNGSGGASARWAASETALNHLTSSPAHSPCLPGSRPLMCHASTQKDRLSPSTEGLGSSLAALSSSGSASAGGARQRQRRHSARLRNMMSLSRRGDLDAQIFLGVNDGSGVTLQSSRLSASAASASSSGESSSAGAGSQRSRRIVKSSTLTRIVDATAPLPIAAGPLVNAQSSPLKPPPPSTNSSPRSAPSDGELCLGHVDETSNFSEQAWDNYLERYASEAYSEDPPDADSARRLLEFGEDYRNDLDSLSDCPSSLSADLRGFRPHHLPKRSPPKRPKGFGMADRSALTELRLLDSDSDVDDLVHVVETSASQFTIALNTFHKVVNTNRLEPSQYAELLATCRTNLQCLQTILSHLKMSADEHALKPVRDLIDKWAQLDTEVAPLLQDGLLQRQLQQQVQTVRNKLVELEGLVLDTGVDGDFQLNLNKIHQIKAQIDAEKESLLQINVDVHSCMAKQPSTEDGINLKEDVSGLYHMWEALVLKVSEKEALLEDAERTWKEFQELLLNLKAEIAADQKKVRSYIDFQNSDPSQPAPVATLDTCQSSKWMENWSSIQLSVQCDSGISSGSDGEFISLGEREKRLHSLRQLARKLETALAPGNAALTRINRTLDQTQQDLILLHSQLSQLPQPVKVSPTASHAQTLILPPPVKEISVQTDPLLVPKKKQQRRAGAVASTAAACRSAVPYWWRIVRAALPFHLALIALLLAACVMEPSCCNYLNTFGSSLVPKLSYLGGPPPI